jgi:DNA-binding transcriptional LysR family regulator
MQVQDSDLKLLRIFETIVQCGGFAAAQPVLNIGASSISEYVSQLETRLGLRLCERGRSGFRLTEKGADLHAVAQRLFGAIDTFQMEAGALRDELSGVLRLGIVEATLTDKNSPMPEAIRTFGRAAPAVKLKVQIDAPSSLEQHVLDGRLHLALGPFPAKIPGLEYTLLYREEQGLYCSSGHPLFARSNTRISPAVLSKHRLAARGYLGARELRMLHMTEAAASVDNVEGRAMLILSGNFIGFLPPHYAQPWVNDGSLARIDSRHYATHLDFHLITRKGGNSVRTVHAFLSHVSDANRPARKS